MFKIDKSSVEYMDQNMSLYVVRDEGPDRVDKKTPPEPVRAAESQAQTIQQKAAAEAEALLAKARRQAENIKQAAWQEGFAAGRAEFVSQQEKQAGLLDRIDQKIASFKASLAGELDDSILQLALAIAEKIVDKELEKDDMLFKELIHAALDQISEKEKIKVRLSPEDYLQMTPDGEEELKERSNCQDFSIARDAGLQAGDCLIEFSSGILNAGVNSQLKLIAWALGQKD